jgi:hypothetical protein
MGNARTVLKILIVIGATIALMAGLVLVGLRWGVRPGGVVPSGDHGVVLAGYAL